MRAQLGLVATMALGLAACGAITGLGDYSIGDEGDDASTYQAPSTGLDAAVPGDATVPGEASAASDDATSDAAGGEDAGEGGAIGEPDGEATGDGASPGGDAAPVDSGEHDAAPDALPPCTTSSCPGCCTSTGICAGGQSVSSCGTGGEACQTCSGSTPDCSSGGACVAAPKDAGMSPPPVCVQSHCGSCSFLQLPCCKSDETCGCAYDWSSGTCD